MLRPPAGARPMNASPALGDKRVPPGVCGRPLSRCDRLTPGPPVGAGGANDGRSAPLVLSPKSRRPLERIQVDQDCGFA